MGVTGLWTLLDAVGKPVPLETLENKTLSVDVSIWLNQAVRGFRDHSGNAVANAHLLGLFHRICKLLFYRIRPIFVFDGKAPSLKRETLNRRRKKRTNAAKKSSQARSKLLENLVRRQEVASKLKRQTHALNDVLQRGQEGIVRLMNDRSKEVEKDLFELPALPPGHEFEESSSDESADEFREEALRNLDVSDIHSLDVSSRYFKSLPTQMQYELLKDLKDRRKLNSWHKMSEMPQNADGFSGFQLQRLIKRKEVQSTFETVGKTLSEETHGGLDAALFVGDKEALKRAKKETRKIVSDRSGGYSVLISGLKQSADEEKTGAEERRGEGEEAMKMAQSDELSQEEILGMIRSEGPSLGKSLSDDESYSDIELLEPSTNVRSSNRAGGKRHFDGAGKRDTFSPCCSKSLAKEEPAGRCRQEKGESTGEKDDTEKAHEDVAYMSSDDSSDSEEDMFADVFKDDEDTQKIDEIIASAQPGGERTPDNVKLVESVSQFDHVDDVFAQVSRKVRRFPDDGGSGVDDGGTEIIGEKGGSDLGKQGQAGQGLQGIKLSERMNAKDEEPDCGDSSNDEVDLFADVFRDETATKALDKIIASARQKDEKVPGNAQLVESVTRVDEVGHAFASKEVTQRENSKDERKSQGCDKTINKDIADKMKKSDHLWLKIASKWADERKTESIEEKKPAGSLKPSMDTFDLEREKLLKEMKEAENERRLLAIKASSNVSNEGTEERTAADDMENGDSDLLAGLGVKVVSQTEYAELVRKEEGLVNKALLKGKVYGDAVPGFVRSKRYEVIEAEGASNCAIVEHAMEKLDYDDEESALTEKELTALQDQLAKEQESLIAERGREERLAASITDQMYSDCQDLLRLFGIPWVVSPSEAEAQCAFLDEIGLSNGTITDDSDIWVFGGKTVYKNFFEKEKYCERYSLGEISKHFGLSREKMVLIAMMTGSDYTEGLEGVGPVNAMEILAEFPGQGLEPLESLKSWWKECQEGAKVPGNQRKFKFRTLDLPQRFPYENVFQAYVEPVIDTSKETFTWAIPNFVAIRDFAVEKFGWTKGRIDEMVKPVIKKMAGSTHQSRIDNYFLSERHKLPMKGNLQSSKRVKEAIEKVLRGGAARERKRSSLKDAEPSPKRQAKQQSESEVLPTKSDEKSEAKRKAIEVYQKGMRNRRKRTKVLQVKRKVLGKHNLSESEDSN